MAQGILQIFEDGFAGSPSAGLIDIVFVHGLGGDRIATWQRSTTTYWPRWLSAEFPECRVYTYGFDSSALASVLGGPGASLNDLAGSLAEALLNRKTPSPYVAFICHSLGGLIVKQMWRRCADTSDSDYRDLGREVVGMAFVGTPHQGASLATSVNRLLSRFTSKQAQQLVYAGDMLIDLHSFFRSRAVKLDLIVHSYHETNHTYGFHIVDQVTGNPGIHGCEPVAIQDDHFGICKPESKDSSLYLSICRYVRKATKKHQVGPASESGAGGDLATGEDAPSRPPSDIQRAYDFYTTVAEDDRRDLAKKLEDAGRAYDVGYAKRRKESFHSIIRQHAAQPSAIARYTRLMSEVESRFRRHVSPAIVNGEVHSVVDDLIQEKVVDACLAKEDFPDESLTAASVDGAIYYLAGNCHLAWDNE